MKIRSICFALIGLAMTCSLYACAAVVAGGAGAAATYTYVEGKVSVYRDVRVGHAYAAALKACRTLGLYIEKQNQNLTKATISGKDGNRPFWIWISTDNNVTSKISVRVGLFGDRAASCKIQDAIASHL